MPLDAQRNATITLRPTGNETYAAPYPFVRNAAEFQCSGRYIEPVYSAAMADDRVAAGMGSRDHVRVPRSTG